MSPDDDAGSGRHTATPQFRRTPGAWSPAAATHPASPLGEPSAVAPHSAVRRRREPIPACAIVMGLAAPASARPASTLAQGRVPAGTDPATGARPGNDIGTGISLPMSDRAGNITPQNMTSPIAARLPAPPPLDDSAVVATSCSRRTRTRRRTHRRGAAGAGGDPGAGSFGAAVSDLGANPRFDGRAHHAGAANARQWRPAGGDAAAGASHRGGRFINRAMPSRRLIQINVGIADCRQSASDRRAYVQIYSGPRHRCADG